MTRTTKTAPAATAKALFAALDRLPVAFALFDSARRLAAWNARLASLGLLPKSLLKQGTPLAEFLRRDPGLKRRAARPHDVTLPAGIVLQVTRRRVPPGQLLLTYEDVTEARLAARRYDTALRAINEGVYDWDVVNATAYFSDGVHRALGMSSKALRTPRDWRGRIHPEDLPKFDTAMVAHFKGRTERFECDYRFRSKDGSWRWARQHGIAMRDARGRAVRMVGSTGDINELKRIEQALKASEERYALATRAATEGIYDWNLENGSLYLSDRGKAFFAVTGDALTPADWNARVHGEDFQGYRDAIAEYFKGRRPNLEHEYRIRNAAGGWSWVADRAVAVRNESGRVIRLIGALSDVTQRKLHEDELRRARDEATEALEQQTATSEVLKAISRSTFDLSAVLQVLIENATRLAGANQGFVFRFDGEVARMAYSYNARPAYTALIEANPIPPGRGSLVGRTLLERRPVHIPDVLEDKEFTWSEARRLGGFRSMLGVPMLREGSLIGVIAVWSEEVRPFTERQIGLVSTFADQAVIAIENVRLFNETRESLERQTATAEILKVIASSPADVQPVFDAIAASARRLFGGNASSVTQVVGDMLHLAAFTATSEAGNEALKTSFPRPLSSPGLHTMAALSRKPAYSIDYENDPKVPPEIKAMVRARGIRSQLTVPMLREGVSIGTIAVTRTEPGQFTDHQINLMETFADQAVIAIENVRLFNETKEALERQTATAEILKVIASSPSDVQPVLDAIVQSAARLFAPCFAALVMREGEQMVLRGRSGLAPAQHEASARMYPAPFNPRTSVTSQAVESCQVIQIPDTEAAGVLDRVTAAGRAAGYRSLTVAPLVRDGVGIGCIGVTSPKAGLTLSDKQLSLLKTFADQAVIAIENVRLFKELEARNRDITDALERQTATAEILKVISSSPSDLRPMFDSILENALRLCDAQLGTLGLYSGERYQHKAQRGATPEFAEWLFRPPFAPDPRTSVGRMVSECQPIHHADIRESLGYREGVEGMVRMADLTGGRSYMAVPMLKEGRAVGGIIIYRREVRPFTQKQIDLLSTFASQAVIAIENVRLFKELEARTEALTRSVGQLTALGEVGQAISSTLDLETVLKTIVSRALQLTGLDAGVIYEYDEQAGRFQLRASESFDEESVAGLRAADVRKGEGAVGACVATREPVQVPDTHAPDYPARLRALLDRSGLRALLAVPLLREDHIVGALLVIRKAAGQFPPEIVDLLKTFAAQSALAIQNARLFREIAEKGRQLEEASRHKSQFLASMSHELRTPLNAILGFNEMILGQVYGEVPKDMQEPLADIQTSGKHLLRLINNVLDLAKIEAGRMELSLADYSVQDTVESVRSTLRPLAADKGLEFLASVPNDLPLAYGDPGRIAQCLMNLAGNSLKFTKAGKVEISAKEEGGLLTYRVADTGMGIPPDKIESLFTEFKQTDATIASEYGGTGLGLSISRKFVEMHGGRIWVESELGKGSAFIIEVPLRAKTT